jgi:hypothetical protein
MLDKQKQYFDEQEAYWIPLIKNAPSFLMKRELMERENKAKEFFEVSEEFQEQIWPEAKNCSLYGLDLICTSEMCPEQYNVLHKGKKVGYIRIRHGKLRADYYSEDGTPWIVYKKEVYGYGDLDKNERYTELSNCAKSIQQSLHAN